MNGHQRQREQSGRMIESALFALMKEKDFAQITVSEIVSRADVARRTFYRLYNNKEDVLQCCFDRLCQEYCNTYHALKTYDLKQIPEEYFSFWYKYKDVLLLLHRCGLDERLYYAIGRASAEVVENRIGGSGGIDSRETEIFADYSTGGFILLLHRWVSEEMREEPQQYARTVSSALLKFIRPAEN